MSITIKEEAGIAAMREACRIAGQVRSPVSYAGSYLLQCDKAFVPMEIAVEDKAPYRIHSMLIRPGYWKK